MRTETEIATHYQDGYGRTLTVTTTIRTRLEGTAATHQEVVGYALNGDEFTESELRQAAEYLLYAKNHSARQYDEEYNWCREVFEPSHTEEN